MGNKMFTECHSYFRSAYGLPLRMLFATLLLLVCCSSGQAQTAGRANQVTVSGQVTEKATGQALVGVSVRVKNSTDGVVSDANGNYRIQVPANSTLLFTYIGYGDVEEVVGNRSTISPQLENSDKALNEVVVVGYGSQSKREITGSVVSVGAKQIQDRPVVSFGEALAGQVAGVQIQQTSAAPGGGLSIKIRGTGSITAGIQPLYVIDGVPLDNSVTNSAAQGGDIGSQSPVNPLASINPGDIQSIDILKDAAATSIYGSRGSNGVVIITTKQGAAGKSQISINASYGFQKIADRVGLMTNEEYARRQIDIRNNDWVRAGGKATDPNSVRSGPGFKIPDEFKNPSAYPYTDWQEELYRTAPMQNYQIAASGGTENARYYVSGNYQNQEGIIVNSGFKKYAFRLNVDAKVSDRIRVGARVAPSYTNNRIATSGGIQDYGAVAVTVMSTPGFYPVRTPDGAYSRSFTLHFDDGTTQNIIYNNALAFGEGIQNTMNQFSTVGSLFTTVDILKNLQFKTSINADVNTFSNNKFSPSYISVSPSNGRSFSSANISWINENTLTYDNSFAEKHHVNVLVGVTGQKSSFNSNSVNANSFPNDLVPTLNAGIVTGGSSSRSQWTLLSFLSRATYNYDEKYFLTATFRRDGSSRFGADNKWGNFPSVSAGWRIGQEKFMANVPAISELKVRASYGLIGNNQIPDYASVGLINSANYILGAGDGAIINGLAQGSLGNSILGWEKAKEVDFGIDLGLFQNRLFLNLDYYNKLTSDLLLNVPVPLSTGFETALRNLGSLRNKGFEVALETRNFTRKNFTWSTNANISFNTNIVETLGASGAPIIVANRAQENSLTHITQIGKPLGSYYGLVFDGIYNTQAEIDGSARLPNTFPGDVRFKDLNGDKLINDADRTIIGNNLPKFTYGITNNFNVGNFDFGVSLQGVQDVDVMNLTKRSVYRNNASISNNYWRSPEEPGDGKTWAANNSANNRNISSYFVEDASFLRIRNVTIGYRFDKIFGGKVFKNARAYMNIQNLHTFTKYSGYNPEVNTTEGDPWISSALTPGIDYGTYPVARTIVFGLNLGF
ncbi:SusC/RagA family TonB-linked outer membrane protein [Dyadobacter aurulentus]|uniref:SusC/RagA family TonB-linked outer membrane protein n=1 Tax=Dyadobacter sp. UC 10 TaxID=2605428 RepID=UPI0011F0D8A8|nr:TonB-dependent receptor [Dyadobacter sp. UC 10]KAA0992231.1 TonB-dependent receptor [Dyadobacter sp. UC 10]